MEQEGWKKALSKVGAETVEVLSMVSPRHVTKRISVGRVNCKARSRWWAAWDGSLKVCTLTL